jgi:hypothetical protein
MLQNTAQALVDAVVSASSDLLFPLMFMGFGGALFLKSLVVFTIRRQWWFSKEFEKRLVRHLESKELIRQGSFFVTLKKILERTYYELFEVRGIMMRRKLDYVTSPIDRLFAIQHGAALIVKDTLHEVKFLHKDRDPPFVDVAKSVCSKNPCFGRLFGWIPLGPLNDLLNLIPGLFIIGGIFGTFLGIMEALPELSMLDLKNADASKVVMDTFLLKISFSISTSIVGIIFSVALTVFYSLTAPEKTFIKVVDVYTRCLTRLWEASLTNDIPEKIEEFDEHRDPLEALAHLAVTKGAQQGSSSPANGEERKAS